MKCILLAIIILRATVSQGQERPTILAGHGTLSGSILPLWVGAEAKLFDKHGLQVKPIYLPRAAGRPALLSGDIQVYFSAGPGADAIKRRRYCHHLLCEPQAYLKDHGDSEHPKGRGSTGQGVGCGQPGICQRLRRETVHCPLWHEARPGYFAHL